MNPSYEYELLHQFEVIFRDGEHKTQAASRDYSNVWENVIDNPPDEGVTPVHVYRMNGTTCAVIAGMDELVENEECAMEIVRLATALAACALQSKRVAVEAKIEVLEEEDAHMVAFLGGTYTDENREWRQAKIEALLAKVAELEETLSHVPMGMRR